MNTYKNLCDEASLKSFINSVNLPVNSVNLPVNSFGFYCTRLYCMKIRNYIFSFSVLFFLSTG